MKKEKLRVTQNLRIELSPDEVKKAVAKFARLDKAHAVVVELRGDGGAVVKATVERFGGQQ